MATWVGSLMKSLRSTEHVLNRVSNASYDQFKLSSKMPHNPNMVFLGGSSPKVQDHLDNCFQDLKLMRSADYLSSDSSASPSRQMARALVDEYKFSGKVLLDYPRNIQEAAELDLYLEGVNLAVVLEGNELSASEKQVAEYYAERGLLLRHEVNLRQDKEEQREVFNDAVLGAIKL